MLDDLKNTIFPLVQSYFSKHETIEESTLDIFLESMGLLKEWKESRQIKDLCFRKTSQNTRKAKGTGTYKKERHDELVAKLLVLRKVFEN